MRFNPLATVLACTCVMMAGAGLATRYSPPAQADAWTAGAGGVAFHDEYLSLLTAPGPRQQGQKSGQREAAKTFPQVDGASVRAVRVTRQSRSPAVEIEFVDSAGRAHLRRYPLERGTVGMRASDAELDSRESARESAGNSRRGRRTNSHRYRRWWP
jgi:hypothetical protein